MPPIYVSPGIGDQIGATLLAYGVLAALFHRERHGVGQRVSTSLLGGLVSHQGFYVNPTLLTGRKLERPERKRARNPIYNFYKCKDDRWIALGCGQFTKHWSRVCRAMNLPERRALSS